MAAPHEVPNPPDDFRVFVSAAAMTLALVPQSRPPMAVTEEPSDADLVARARAGSRPAFEALVRRYQKPLYFFCLRYVRDHDAAADLAQRTFIKALDKMDELRDARIFRSWLYRIGGNLALNHLRDNARFVEEETAPGEEALAPETEAQMVAAEDAMALRRAVGELPTKQRLTLELRIYEELSFKDIAEALDTTEGAAKVNFHYAVRRLRALLGKSGAGLGAGKAK
jgi:RNA polymerase sigma-70 factor (ECF subfamily)